MPENKASLLSENRPKCCTSKPHSIVKALRMAWLNKHLKEISHVLKDWIFTRRKRNKRLNSDFFSSSFSFSLSLSFCFFFPFYDLIIRKNTSAEKHSLTKAHINTFMNKTCEILLSKLFSFTIYQIVGFSFLILLKCVFETGNFLPSVLCSYIIV